MFWRVKGARSIRYYFLFGIFLLFLSELYDPRGGVKKVGDESKHEVKRMKEGGEHTGDFFAHRSKFFSQAVLHKCTNIAVYTLV